jgi:hypothetical protein
VILQQVTRAIPTFRGTAKIRVLRLPMSRRFVRICRPLGKRKIQK